MKKIAIFVLVLLCVVALVGCSPAYTEGSVLLKEGTVKRISVSSLPKGSDYSYTGKDARAILDYLSSLDLVEDPEEVPPGMVWIIEVEYEDESTEKIYNYNDKFKSDSPWYKMTDEQEKSFDKLLNELNGHK